MPYTALDLCCQKRVYKRKMAEEALDVGDHASIQGQVAGVVTLSNVVRFARPADRSVEPEENMTSESAVRRTIRAAGRESSNAESKVSLHKAKTSDTARVAVYRARNMNRSQGHRASPMC